MATGIRAPITQVTWKRVSKRAKARPRLASGASRWRIESNASFPAPAAKPTEAPSSDAPSTSPTISARNPPTTSRASTPVRMFSSEVSCRSLGATAAPASWLSTLTAPTTPNCQAGRSPPRKSNATSRVRKPTHARIRPMALPAMMIVAPRSSWRSASSGRVVATWALEMPVASTAATT